jgi:hypothetical protein
MDMNRLVEGAFGALDSVPFTVELAPEQRASLATEVLRAQAFDTSIRALCASIDNLADAIRNRDA